MKGLLSISLLFCLLMSTSSHAAKLKTTADPRFEEFQYISQVKSVEDDHNSTFTLVERLGFDSPGSYAKLVLTVVQDQGAGTTLTYELPIEQGISPDLYGKLKAKGDTLTFTGLMVRTERIVELQDHKIVFERKNDELTGRATLTSGKPYSKSSWYEFHTE